MNWSDSEAEDTEVKLPLQPLQTQTQTQTQKIVDKNQEMILMEPKIESAQNVQTIDVVENQASVESIQKDTESDIVSAKQIFDILKNQVISESIDYQSFMNTEAFKKAKKRAIFTKNMHSSMPVLRWLPGEAIQLFPNAQNEAHYSRFIKEANDHRIISMMIYIQQDVATQLCYLTLSTPLTTLIFDIKDELNRDGRFCFPSPIYDILSDPGITVVIPGREDWHKSQLIDCLLYLRNFVSSMPSLPNLVHLVDYLKMLAIQPSCVGLPDHMKMLHWIFQVRFNSQLYGDTVPTYLTPPWIHMTHHYGLLMICLYHALEKKKAKICRNPYNGVDMSPIYLESILIEKNYVEGMTSEQLKKKLIGVMKYPNPPLPALPLPTKV